MATKKRSGLGRGIGALIPQTSTSGERPVDVFFPANGGAPATGAAASVVAEAEAEAAAAGVADAAETRAAGSGPAEDADAGGDEELREVPGATLTRLDVDDIVPNRVQPRTEFDEEALEELTHSVREFGVFQPIVVRPLEPAPAEGEPRYELIMGERRLRASKRAGLETIPAIVRSTADENMLRDALLENLHRAELNPLEEASAYQQLLSDFGITQEQLAARIGRSRPQISNTIRLLRLPEPVQARVAAGVLSAGHARAILSLDGDVEAMQGLAEKIVNEGLSVRAAEAAANEAPKRKLPRPRAGGRQAQLNEIAERLGDRFDTRVNVKLGAKKGQIIIDFATIQDLKRILAELDDPGFA
ncbi:ParB/RepB/Spo0J family partition protein [Leucobacter sp. CSA1]|uniref:ParB/RepB/Spo0J family partition protein n=1 Tax=Leucobacter chromiisoli TaxID=2796471 RepID=A0A934Q7W5_9MICO|nr:ParB/RepB/Spo0J family partition protein [Leucobacter chromiisoli]MBK0418726.1 ParB/RepB/Spo0J family partition protein [Leucobacter chromiisoli]